MTTVIFKKSTEHSGWDASTGEAINLFSAQQVYGRGSRGWYITESDGSFSGIKFDSLADAKMFLTRRHNPELWMQIKTAQILEKAGA